MRPTRQFLDAGLHGNNNINVSVYRALTMRQSSPGSSHVRRLSANPQTTRAVSPPVSYVDALTLLVGRHEGQPACKN